MTAAVSRLAPSPTGSLHLGNARTFLINWALARSRAWRLILRIEDLDGPRVKPDSARQMIDTLAWLGLDHDGEPTWQSHDLEPYRAAMAELARRGAVYSCNLTRSQIIAAASAPHLDDHELRFPLNLRPADRALFHFDNPECGYRFIVPDENVAIDDRIAGARTFRPAQEVGDFIVWTKRGTPSYQLAVVVDDHRQGVTDVVRGDDLLASAARQALLYRALGWHPPRWWHVPLVLGPDGMRLAKRHGDARLDTYRKAGVSPQRIIGLLAFWCGVIDRRDEMTAADFRDRFSLDTLDRRPITLLPEDLAWLLHRR